MCRVARTQRLGRLKAIANDFLTPTIDEISLIFKNSRVCKLNQNYRGISASSNYSASSTCLSCYISNIYSSACAHDLFFNKVEH